MTQATPNAIFTNMGRYVIGEWQQLRMGVAHGNAQSNDFEHFLVIKSVTEGKCFLRRQSQMLQQRGNAKRLGAIIRKHVHCKRVPANIAQARDDVCIKMLVLRLTVQEDLINVCFFPKAWIKARLCHAQRRYGVEHLRMRLRIGEKRVMAFKDERMVMKSGMLNKRLDICARNRIMVYGNTVVNDISSVKADEGVDRKLLGNILEKIRRASRRNDSLDALLLNFTNRINRILGNLFIFI